MDDFAKYKITQLIDETVKLTSKTSDEQIEWKVIQEHVPNQKFREHPHSKLGIKDYCPCQHIIESNLPAAEIFSHLYIKRADWQGLYQTLNDYVVMYNLEAHCCACSQSHHPRLVQDFSVPELMCAFGILIGATDCSQCGANLFKSEVERQNLNEWESIAPQATSAST